MTQYSVSKLVEESGKTEDEVRYLLLDSYPNPDTVEEITAADYEAVLAAFTTKDGSLTLKAATSISEQQSQTAIINIASQILEVELQANFESEVLNKVQEAALRNEVVKQVYAQADMDLANFLNQRTQQSLDSHERAMETLQELMPTGESLEESLTSIKERQAVLQERIKKMRQSNQDFLDRNSQISA